MNSEKISAPTPFPTYGHHDYQQTRGFGGIVFFLFLMMSWCFMMMLFTLGAYTVITCIVLLCRDCVRFCGMSWYFAYPFYVTGFLTREPGGAPGIHASIAARKHADSDYFTANRDSLCTICLVDMEPGDMTKELRCRHCFHAECLDPWLDLSVTCPVGNFCLFCFVLIPLFPRGI